MDQNFPMPSEQGGKSKLFKSLLVGGLVVAVIGGTYLANDAGLFQGQLKLNRNNPAINLGGGQQVEGINNNQIGQNRNWIKNGVDKRVQDEMVRVEDVGGLREQGIDPRSGKSGVDVKGVDRTGLGGMLGDKGMNPDPFSGHNRPGGISDGRGMASDGDTDSVETRIGGGLVDAYSGSERGKTTQSPNGFTGGYSESSTETRRYDSSDKENNPDGVESITFTTTKIYDDQGNHVSTVVDATITYSNGKTGTTGGTFPKTTGADCPPDQECGDSGRSMEQTVMEICRTIRGCDSNSSPAEILRLMMGEADCDGRNESCMHSITGGNIDWSGFFARVNSAGGNCEGRNDEICIENGGGNFSQQDLEVREGIAGGGPNDPVGGIDGPTPEPPK